MDWQIENHLGVPQFQAVLPACVLAPMVEAAISVIPEKVSESRFKGALLHIRDAAAVMVATDGCRLVHVESSASMNDTWGQFTSVVPWKALQQIKNALSDKPDATIEVATGKANLHFHVDQHYFNVERSNDWFPDYSRVLRDDYPNAAILNSDRFRKAMNRVASDDAPCVRLQFLPGEIIFNIGSATGEFE